MDETLREIYDLAFSQWPYVAAAYAVLWVALVAYIAMAVGRVSRLEKQLAVLEEALERRSGSAS